MNNSVFGKTMENIRKHRDINLVTNEEMYLMGVIKPNFKSRIVFSENLMEYKMGKIRVIMNKPIYLRQATLDLSKIIMYEFHYDYIKPKYGMNLRLCYMNTDSLVYDIKNDNFYKDMAGNVEARFDIRSYSCSCPLPMRVNKKIIGLMKDELGRRIMTELLAFSLKLYTYETLGWNRNKKWKGVKMQDFKDYKQCLLAGHNAFKKKLLFWNKLYEVHTVEVNK